MTEPIRVRVQGGQSGYDTVVTDIETGRILPTTRVDLKLASGEFTVAHLDVVVDEVDVEAEVVPRTAATIAEFAVSKLDLEPGDVIVVVPAPGIVNTPEETRSLQEAIQHAFQALGSTNEALVMPPGTMLTTLRGLGRVPEEERCSVCGWPDHSAEWKHGPVEEAAPPSPTHHHRDLAD